MSRKMSNMEQRILVLEKELNVSSQRMRENNIEFTGVPDSVQDVSLESKLFELM